MYKRVSGTKDILPEDIINWQGIEEICRKTFRLYNYSEIRTPLIEDSALFNRSLGQTTEIIQKQMFIFNNKDESYALRPEGTASIVRAYIENNLDKSSRFLKFYYMGPMFRLERPQKGRLRQFNHIGCEAIGSYDAYLDTEVIALSDALLSRIGVKDAKIKINTLGCAADKAALAEKLRNELEPCAELLCEECRKRLKTNVLRILDCKTESCRKIVQGLRNNKQEYLCNDCRNHFDEVKKGLDSLKIKYTLDHNLVRGLDYYTQTVFEITHDSLGAQDAIGAGGRYNNLVKELGGPDLGAIGFAFGMERLMLSLKTKINLEENKLIYIVTLGKEAMLSGAQALEILRKNNIAADMDYEKKSVKGAMRRASDLNARYALIIGDDELKKGILTLKDMQKGTQTETTLDNLIKEMKC